jgi:hypothetical protein
MILSGKSVEDIYNEISSVICSKKISEICTDNFEKHLDFKTKEIQRNYSGNRTIEEIKNCVRSGYINEFVFSELCNLKRNMLDFNCKIPETFYYDLSDDVGTKIEVKSWNPKKSKWLNFNIDSMKTEQFVTYISGSGHFDTLIKYNKNIDYVCTFYKEQDSLLLSGVFYANVFHLYDGKNYGKYVKISNTGYGNAKTTHYINIHAVKMDKKGFFL